MIVKKLISFFLLPKILPTHTDTKYRDLCSEKKKLIKICLTNSEMNSQCLKNTVGMLKLSLEASYI